MEYRDKIIQLTAPLGGVIKDCPCVVQNHFAVAIETKAAELLR